MTRRRLASSALVAVAALSSGACATEGLSFVRDDRVEIEAPDENATVRLPVEVQWTAKDFDGRFAVFVDRAPMRPNKTLLSIVPENDTCRQDDTCLTEQWLTEHFVYVTEGTSVTIDRVPARRHQRDRERYELTIALLDGEGKRMGESAFTTEFFVEREG